MVDWQAGKVSWERRPEHRWPARIVSWSILALLGLAAVAALAWLTHRAWPSQEALTLTFVLLFLALGAWTSVSGRPQSTRRARRSVRPAMSGSSRASPCSSTAVWMNDTSWSQLTTLNPQGMAPGKIDGK